MDYFSAIYYTPVWQVFQMCWEKMTQYYTSKALHMWLEKILWENMHSNYILNIQKYLAFFQ